MDDQQRNEKLLSIIVPVYNVEGYLERCVNSLLEQTYTNLQIILVDDGSTDGSGALCDRFARQDERIQVIHKTNGGLSDARNAGMAQARGRYIAFVDSDDYTHHRMYEVMIHKLELHDADIANCCYYKVFRTLQDQPYRDCAVSIVDRNTALTGLMRWERFDVPTWNKVFKREMVEGIPFPVGKIYEDIFWTYKALFRAKKLIHLDVGLYYYQQARPGSIVNAPYSEKNLVETEALFERIAFMQENAPELVDEARRGMGKYIFDQMMRMTVWDRQPRKVRLALFLHFAELMHNLSSEEWEPYCRISKRKRIKVYGCRVLERISPRLLFVVYGLSQRLIRGRKPLEIHIPNEYDLWG